MTDVQRGRRRQQALFDLLGMYQAATTDQLAALIWGGNQRLAREHLLAYTRAGKLRRIPHPVFRNGAYVYTRGSKATSHSQKILHHLAAMDFHIAVARHLGRYGARTVAEMSWAQGLQPDQTIIWKDTVWAIEHHLSGPFAHGADYRRFLEEEGYMQCHWWRPGLRIGLLVVTVPVFLDHVQGQLKRHNPRGFTWRVGTRENVLKDPGVWLK